MVKAVLVPKPIKSLPERSEHVAIHEGIYDTVDAVKVVNPMETGLAKLAMPFN